MSNEWISTSERMPEYEGLYLIYAYNKVMCAYRQVFFFSEVWNNDLTGGFSIIKDEDVTHWMPLPEPPKEGADNG